MRRAFSSLREHVLFIIAIPFAVMLGMTVYHALREREMELAGARMQVLNAAQLMAREQERIVEHVHRVLWSVATQPEVSRGVASAACDRVLANELKQESSVSNFALALANGTVICNATAVAKPISIADRDHFNGAIETRQFAAGGYIVSRSTGIRSLGLALPLLDEAGVPYAVVAASVNLHWLERELANARLVQGARVVVADGKGLVLARYPDPEGLVGTRAADLPLLRKILAKGGAGTEEEIGLDGRLRIFGFAPLYQTAGGQAYLWVAIPKDVVLGPAQRAFVVSLTAELALIVLTFTLVWQRSKSKFLRRIEALTRAAKDLGEGKLDARTGLADSSDEIGQLAQSFDAMADAYQHHEEKLRESVAGSIQALSGTEAMRSPYIAAHQRRVASLAAAIAGELGLPKDEIHGIKLAASIHDLGKMQVPAEILSKPKNALTANETTLLKAHVQAGYDILKEIEFPWPIANIVLQHHERLDGSGYPNGLKGDQILPGARIVTVANVVEQLTSDEPYRPAPGLDAALAQIRQDAGTKLDALVVDACERVFREQGFAFSQA